MPVPSASGYPVHSFGQGNQSNWIPVLFAGKTLEKFYAASTVTNISTTDYVGEVKNVGDRVIIRTVPNITIRDYQKGGTLTLEYPDSPAVEFTINKAKYYNFAMDDIDIKETDIDWMSKFADDAAQQLKIVFDTQVFANVYGDVDSHNTGTTAGKLSGDINLGAAGNPVALTKSNVLEVLVDCNTVLDEQNIPETDRWIVIPPRIAGLIKKSDIKDASLTGDPKSVLRSGLIGSIDRFNIYVSNLLSYNTTDKAWHIVFGHKSSLIFVMQLTKNESYRPHNTFANAMKGLAVYDFDVIQPTAMGHLYAKLGT
jgi:hypothetical protein